MYNVVKIYTVLQIVTTTTQSYVAWHYVMSMI